MLHFPTRLKASEGVDTRALSQCAQPSQQLVALVEIPLEPGLLSLQYQIQVSDNHAGEYTVFNEKHPLAVRVPQHRQVLCREFGVWPSTSMPQQIQGQ